MLLVKSHTGLEPLKLFPLSQLLTRAIEKKTAEAHEKRRALDKELIETQSTQVQVSAVTAGHHVLSQMA